MLPDREPGFNPARMESEILYSEETHKKAKDSIDDFNAFWRKKTFGAISRQPVQWLGLTLRKIYYLLNNFEQYNNKTYSFHKSLSPVLRYNPLCFGLLLILFAISIFNAKQSDAAKLLIKTVVFLSLGILLFYVSARFRMLVVPLLVVISAGIFEVSNTGLYNIKTAVLIFLVGLLTFSGLFSANSHTTYNSDRLLLAHACARLNLDAQQVAWCDEVLNNDPENIMAIRVKLVGFTNMALAGMFKDKSAWQNINHEIAMLEKLQVQFPDTLFISGCYAYTVEKDSARAIKYWHKGLADSEQKDLFLSALIICGERKPDHSMLEAAQTSPLLCYALKISGFQSVPEIENEKTYRNAIRFLFGIEG